MHPLNPYLNKKPDFANLATLYSSFAPYVKLSESGYASIDFQDAAALRALTTVLLKEDWEYEVELRDDRLCPTIANRLDYLYHILDIEAYLHEHQPTSSTSSRNPLRVLDIGTGHAAIYPLLLRRLRPSAQITGTELDAVSFHHSVKTRQSNNIPSSAISLLRPEADQPILFPIFDNLDSRLRIEDGRTVLAEPEQRGPTRVEETGTKQGEEWDFVICNPPFFASEEEMKQGIDKKLEGAPAAPTAAANELITHGGEVAFVSQMIAESLKLQETCTWYTSLVGKYSSLMTLVERLRRDKIDNYFIKIVKQSRTTRWILGWSFSRVRLPDAITRPKIVIPGTSFTRLLPPPNTFIHANRDFPLPASTYRRIIAEVLKEVQLYGTAAQSPSDDTGASERERVDLSSTQPILVEPKDNTWSRSARRQAARQKTEGGAGQNGTAGNHGQDEVDRPPLFRAEFRFTDDSGTSTINGNPVTGQQGTDLSERRPTYDPSLSDHEMTDALPPDPVADEESPDPTPGADGDDGVAVPKEQGTVPGHKPGGRVELHWLAGRDRTLVEALWKYVLSKADLGKGVSL